MLTAALVTFVGLWLLMRHIPAQTMRRMVGRIALVDWVLHCTLIALFFGTVSGLLQAEAAGIMVSLYLRGYRKAFGYERRELNPATGRKQWMRYPGVFTKLAR